MINKRLLTPKKSFFCQIILSNLCQNHFKNK